MSHVMRRPVLQYANNKSAGQPAHPRSLISTFYCSLPRQYNSSSFYIQHLKSLASLCSWAVQFESYLVVNLEDRFSRDEAQIWVFNLSLLNVMYYFRLSKYLRYQVITLLLYRNVFNLIHNDWIHKNSICSFHMIKNVSDLVLRTFRYMS